MISYLQAVNVIKTFADDHLQINRFGFEFKEQMQNLATLNEAYPFLYVVPLASDTITNVNEFEVEIYCVDRLQKDRTNVNYVVSDTNQILNDLVLWLEEGQDDIEIVGTATQTPINNDLLDYVGGWVLRVRLQVEKIGLCEIPLGGEMPPPPTCENATFQNSDESFVTTIASGDTYTSEDIRVNVYDQNETFLGTATNPSNVDFNVVVELEPCPPSEVNAEAINSLDEIVTTAVLTPTNNQILAPDAHLRIKKSGGANITELDLPSGSDTVETISDSVITLKDSASTTISTTNVQATETANITAPDGLININGSSVGNVKSNGTRNLFVKLNGTNSGVYDGVDTINVTATDAWVRNPDWLPLDTVSAGTNKFSGLFAVYETQKSVCTIQISFPGGGTKLINWGDGTTQVALNNTIYTKVYNYSTISSAILVDEFGFNYKMAVVNVSLTGATTFYIDRNTTATLINNNRILGWLDIALDCLTLNAIIFSTQAKSSLLQRLLIYNMSATVGGCNLQYLPHLRVLKFPFENATTNGVSALFNFNLGQVRNESNNPITLNLTGATGVNSSVIANGLIDKLGNINAPTITNASQFLSTNSMLQEVGTLNFPLATNMSQFLLSCEELVNVGTITTGVSLTNLNSFANGARKVKSLVFTQCLGVTDFTNAFTGMTSLETLILPNATRGFTIDDCNMSATAIDALFTSLGTASGSQTINVRRNRGSATCTTSIATSKGFTVVIA
jgi:hypothetical protein